MADRLLASQAFLKSIGWGSASRSYLAGDASDRSYQRLTIDGKTAVLMDAPPGQGDDPAQFLKIGDHLSSLGLSPPLCIAKDLTQGFLLLEDLGDAVYAPLVERDSTLEMPLYATAVDVLVHLQSQSLPSGLPDLSALDWAKAGGFALDWYRFAITGDRIAPDDFLNTLTQQLQAFADGRRVLILRDYHAENLLWLPDRTGLAKVGLLDFQLAQLGQPAYDLVSLLQDARRDVPLQTEHSMKRRFADATGADDATFEATYAVLGAQRALRILGIFSRLCLVAEKPGYLKLLPRVWGQLQRNLAVPALAPLAKICAEVLPEPTPLALATIGSKCGLFR